MKRLLLATIFGFVLAAPAFAADTISIMVGGLEKQIYLPAMLTQKLGYFKDEGLNVELLNEPAGIEGADAMIAGEVQGVVGFYDHTIDLQSKGKYTESIVQFARVPGEVELISAKLPDSITSFAGLKGKSLGVTGLGSSTNFLTLYMAARAGLKPGDVTTIAVGAGTTFIAAMQQGHIQAGMTTEPTVSRALSTGLARVLVDMRTEKGTQDALGGLYPAACLYMAEPYVKAHPDIAGKLAHAFVRTMHYIASHSAEQIAGELPKDYYAGDKASYVKALEAGKQMWTPDGRMPEGGPQTVLDVLAAFKPQVKNKKIDLSRTYATQFVDAALKQ